MTRERPARELLVARVPFGAVLAAFGALAAFAFALMEPTAHANIYWQIMDGTAIASGHFPAYDAAAISSQPLVLHEWLFELAAGVATAHGLYVLLVLACALAAAAAPLLAYAIANATGATQAASGIVAVFAAGARLTGGAVRPETFAVDFFSLELLVMTGALPLWVSLPVALLWSNVQASAPLAVVVALALAAAATAAYGVHHPFVRRAAFVAAVCGLASLATPYGPALWVYAWQRAIEAHPANAVIATWQPLSFATAGAWAAVLPGLLALVVCGLPLRRRVLPWAVLGAAFFAETLAHQRYATFLTAAWSPVLAQALDRRAPIRSVLGRLEPLPAAALAAIAVVALLFVPQAQRIPVPMPAMRTAAAIASRHGLSGHAYVDLVWAGYLSYRGLPLRMLADGRTDSSFSPQTWRDVAALQKLTPGWREALARNAVRVVIVPAASPLAQALAERADWRLVERRDGVSAFSRPDSDR